MNEGEAGPLNSLGFLPERVLDLKSLRAAFRLRRMDVSEKTASSNARLHLWPACTWFPNK
jgi:hypothetical protein